MLSIRKINPMARAIGTMGVVAAVVGGITFAQIPSNTVTLTDNTITSESAALTIGLGGEGCSGNGSTQTGMAVTGLAPGATSTPPFLFCLTNTGSGNLAVSMDTPTVFGGSIPPGDITLNLTCGGTTTNETLSSLISTPVVADSSLASGATDLCNATVTLNGGYTGNGGSITPFELDFTGSTI